MSEENKLKVNLPLWAKVLPWVGVGAGVFYAWKKKKSVGGYIGFGLLGGVLAGVVVTPIALKRSAKAIGDNLTNQVKDGVSKMSAPTTSSASTKLSREQMINKLTNPTGGKVDGGSMSIEMPKELFSTLTDKELEFMLMMEDIDKEVSKNSPPSKSKEDFIKKEENQKKQAESILLKKGYSKSDVEKMMNTIGEKMQKQGMLLASKK